MSQRPIITVQTLLSTSPDSFTLLRGDAATVVQQITPPESAHSKALVFAAQKDFLQTALNKDFAVLCVNAAMEKELPSSTSGTVIRFNGKDISVAFALLFPLFDQPVQNTSTSNNPTFVDPTARIGQGTVIEPFAVIGKNAVIGSHCRIGSHTVVEESAHIGDGTILHGHSFIGHHCRVGKDCIIHPHVTIGADGFGFARQPDGSMKKIPQLGIVVIEDQVEVGAQSTIDRAALTETRIGQGTKMDDHCHIAHNCTIGAHNVLAAGFFMAGSSHTGSHVTAGGHVDVADHVNITSKVLLAGRSGITNDITEPGAYGGYPLQPLRESLKNIANIGQLTQMRKQIQKILNHLNMEEKGDSL